MQSSLLLAISLPLAFAALDLRQTSFENLVKRQSNGQSSLPCLGPGSTCQSQCGRNHLMCDAARRLCFNNDIYNCCPGGYVCNKNEYCAGDGNCCLIGQTLGECGASTSLATSPGIADATEAPSSSTSAQATVTATFPLLSTSITTTEGPAGYGSPSASSSDPIPSAYPPTSAEVPSTYVPGDTTSHPTIPTGGAIPSTHPHPAQPTGNVTTPSWYPPPQQTNAGTRGEMTGWLSGAMVFLGLGFFV